MANDKKISELTIAQTINATDKSLLISNNADYQFDFSTLLQFINTGLAAGANLSFGTTLPQNISGKNGDVFINTTTGSFAQKIAGVWTVVYTITTGAANDTTVLYGNTAPGTATGNNGDTFINTLSGIFYKKNGGTWNQVFSMQTGPQGPQGTSGTNGTNGANGKTILNGIVNPSNSLGTDGDFYINTSSYYLFGPKTTGLWGVGISLIISGVEFEETENKNAPNGYAGLDNTGKIAVAQLPSYVDDVLEFANLATLPASGETGKIYITTYNNFQYRWSGSTYTQIVGSPGTTDAVSEGTTNKYFTVTRVLNAILTGISFGTSTAISATDTILQALGKLQAQITGLFKIPAGGTNGQVLTKVDSVDGNVHWVDAASGGALPNGGTTGQLLAKNSNVSGDTHWVDVPVGGGIVNGLAPKQVLFGKSDGTISQNLALTFDPTSETLYNNAFSENNTLQIVGIGDSITQDTGASDHAHCYFAITSKILGLTENNHGVSGKTAGTYDSSNIPTYDASNMRYITFAFGTNDVNFGDSAATFNTNYTNIITIAHNKGWPYNKMYFISIPGLFNGGVINVNTPIAVDCNTAMSSLAASVGANYVDIWTPLRTAYYTPIAQTIAFDSNHPNDLGHFIIANIISASIDPIYTITNQGLIVNKPTELLSLLIKRAPLVDDGHLLAIDNYGHLGFTPFLPNNIRTKGNLFIGGAIIQDGAIMPAGYDTIKDILFKVGTKLICAGNNNGDKTAFIPFNGDTGAIEFRHYSGSGSINFFGGKGVTGAQNLLVSIDVSTGILKALNGIELGLGKTITATYIPSIVAKFTLFDDSFNTVLENPYGNIKEKLTGVFTQVIFASGSRIFQKGGTFTEESSSMLSINSITQGSVPWPRMTTTQRMSITAPEEGLVVYDLTLHKLFVNDGSTWQGLW